MKSIIFGSLMALIIQPTFAAEKTVAEKTAPTVAASGSQTVDLQVTDKGFEPKQITVKPGVPLVLKITRKSEMTCATSIQIPDRHIKKELPLNQTVSIEVGKLDKGEVRYGCGMNMMESGQIFVK